jgi:hypothetical protein
MFKVFEFLSIVPDKTLGKTAEPDISLLILCNGISGTKMMYFFINNNVELGLLGK